MYDSDEEMHAYIDKYIIGDRTSDAAEDSAGAAWAAYERGEYQVPSWFSEEYRESKKSPLSRYLKKNWKQALDTDDMTFWTFLKALFYIGIFLIGLSIFISVLSGLLID